MEILDALIRKVAIEASPGKLLLQVASRLQSLHGLHDRKVGHLLVCQLGVFGHMDILGNHHSFLKNELINGNVVILGHQHRGGCRVQDGGWKTQMLER